MSRAIPRRHGAHRPHAMENSLAAVTFVAGLTAFVTGAVHDTHLISVIVGVVTFFFGLYSQLVSATTTERWLNVLGMGLAFVGVGLGLSHGGLAL